MRPVWGARFRADQGRSGSYAFGSGPTNAVAFTDSRSPQHPYPEIGSPSTCSGSAASSPLPTITKQTCARRVQICAQNTLKQSLKRLKSALFRSFALLLGMRFVVFLGLAGLRFRLQFIGRSFRSLLGGDLHSFSIHIDPSFLQACTFPLWSELLFSVPDN